MGKPEQRERRPKQIDFRFRNSDLVGAIAAEQDARLGEAFVDAGYLDVLADTSDPHCIVVGRTGAGKSALLLELERRFDRVQRIDPLSVAIEYVQHTDIPALASAGVNFEPFFRFLWRHVLVLEVLRTWHASKTETKWEEFKLFLTRKVGDRRVDEALDHFEQWCGKDSWNDPRKRTQEIIQKITAKLNVGVGPLSLGSIEVGGESGKKAGAPPIDKTKLSAAQRIISELPRERVRTVNEFLETHVLTDSQQPHYVVIDRLDEAWTDSAFAYEMIDALIHVAGEFGEIPNAKIIVALREDIVTGLRNRANTSSKKQWEKYEGLIQRVRWSKSDLVSLIDRRLKLVLKDRYGGTVSFESLLPPRPKHARDPIDYMIDRTLMRPRDLIEFVNGASARRRETRSRSSAGI
jgi:hypothetical protein